MPRPISRRISYRPIFAGTGSVRDNPDAVYGNSVISFIDLPANALLVCAGREATHAFEELQLALHQCHSTLDAGHNRCQSLKRRQQGELKSFRDQRQRRLEECKRRTKDPKQDRKDEKKNNKKIQKK
jgi:hypothetical protein